MLSSPDEIAWTEAGLLLAFLVGAGFLASWLTTDVLKTSRRTYVGVLILVTAALMAMTADTANVSLSDLVGHRWPAGLVGGVVTGLMVGAGIRKLPPTLRRSGHDLHVAQAWEGVVYGIAEGVLLSGLPVFVAWQAAADAGWSAASSWAISLVASATMITVHHLGYWDFRGRQVIPVVAGCVVLSVGYLASGSLMAPALGHVFMHLTGITAGVELPPHSREPTGLRA